MHEAAQLLASIAAVLLVIAIAAWVKLTRSPSMQRLDGSRVPDNGRVETAARLIVAAVSVSAVAAIFALAGLMSS